MSHDYSGNCNLCSSIIGRYPGFHSGLKGWFKALQKAHPDAHISCAGRGKKDQELCYQWGKSKAHFGQSAHNYNCALDIFQLLCYNLSYDKTWFRNVVGKAVDKQNTDQNRKFDIEWYGSPDARFYELPHCEVKDWRELKLILVEKE